MTKITEKQLIASLSQLKEIKPNQEWASLLKSQILSEATVETKITAQKVSFMEAMVSTFTSRKLVYALSAFLFLVVGVFGITKLTPAPQIAKQPAALTTPMVSSQEVAMLNSKIKDLASASKAGNIASIPPAVTEVKAKVSQVIKSIKDNPKQDPQTIKDIAASLKTLADVPGTDLSSNADIKDLYQTVTQSQISDLKKATLTEDQKKTLTEVEDLYKQKKYSEALEKILLINNK